MSYRTIKVGAASWDVREYVGKTWYYIGWFSRNDDGTWQGGYTTERYPKYFNGLATRNEARKTVLENHRSAGYRCENRQMVDGSQPCGCNA